MTGAQDPAGSATAPSPVDRRSAERTLATAELVLEIATAASGERELDSILRAALDRLRRTIPFTGGSIALVADDQLVIRAALGRFADEAIGQRLPRGPSRSWHVVESLQAARIDDVLAEGRRATGRRAGAEIRSWLAVPIVRRGDGIGLLEIDSVEPAAFGDDDVDLIAAVAGALAGPIDLAARYQAEREAGVIRDAFAGVISHELRTPITTIYGMSQVLRQRVRSMDPEQVAQVVEDIGAEADRLRRLTEDLLVLSRAEAGRLSLARDPILLGHLVRRAVADEQARWPGHRFTVDVPPGLPLVLGEESYTWQVIGNLLSNAGKYSPAGSEVRVVAARERDEVMVRVLDEGIGLPPEEADRLFELFFRTRTASMRAAGAGIGLFVCRQLVEAMGGRMWAVARRPVGAEIGFALPIAPEEPGED